MLNCVKVEKGQLVNYFRNNVDYSIFRDCEPKCVGFAKAKQTKEQFIKEDADFVIKAYRDAKAQGKDCTGTLEVGVYFDSSIAAEGCITLSYKCNIIIG